MKYGTRCTAIFLFVGLHIHSENSHSKPSQEEYELRLKLQEGSQYTEIRKIKMKSKFSSKDETLQKLLSNSDIEMSLEFEITTEVRSVDKEGVGCLEQFLKGMKISGTQGGQRIEFDSTKEDTDKIAQSMRQQWKELTKQRIKSRLDTTGKCTFEQSSKFGAFDLNSMQGLQFMLPKEKVKIGGKWTTETEVALSNLSMIKMKIDYRLDSIDLIDGDKCAVILVDKIEMESTSKDKPFGMDVKIDVKTDARCYLSLSKCVFLKVAGSMAMDGKMIMKTFESEQPKEIAMSVTSELDYSRK
jgi:hypothetical protein